MNFSEAQLMKIILKLVFHVNTVSLRRICLLIIDKVASKTIMIRSIQTSIPRDLKWENIVSHDITSKWN